MTYINHGRIILAATELQRICHDAAWDAGWWTDIETGQSLTFNYERGDTPKRNIGELIALAHSELSEALEGARKRAMDEHLPNRTSFEVELADAVIRIFDIAGGVGLNLAGAIADKLAYNATRGDHTHEQRSAAGGKAF